MSHKSGFVSIIGKPNVGKSTLLNELLGTSLAAVSPKAQTTRHRIKGILTGKDYQIVFSDTPGIIAPAYTLHKRMMDFVQASLEDADIVMMVVEVNEKALSDDVAERLKKLKVPLVIVITKIDLSEQEHLENRVAYWSTELQPAAVVPVSALHHFNTEPLIKTLLEFLPEAPPYYDADDLSDRDTRFFIAEIIRECLLAQYSKEIPYSCEVVVSGYKEDKEIDRIHADIYVTRESQKAILLGNKGTAIKKLGIEARKKAEAFLQKHIYLELTVKVKDNWRDDERQLDKFGYNGN